MAVTILVHQMNGHTGEVFALNGHATVHMVVGVPGARVGSTVTIDGDDHRHIRTLSHHADIAVADGTGQLAVDIAGADLGTDTLETHRAGLARSVVTTWLA